jgi:hypothetical protein
MGCVVTIVVSWDYMRSSIYATPAKVTNLETLTHITFKWNVLLILTYFPGSQEIKKLLKYKKVISTPGGFLYFTYPTANI